MSKLKKTNAMRILDKEKIEYNIMTYSTSDGMNDAISVANKVNELPERVFKTLVLIGKSSELYVCVIPGNEKLSLKKASKLTGEKNIEMLPVNKLLPKTGYIKGGCSPIGMRKKYITYFHESILDLDKVTLSAGHLGTQIIINPKDLIKVSEGIVNDIIQ